MVRALLVSVAAVAIVSGCAGLSSTPAPTATAGTSALGATPTAMATPLAASTAPSASGKVLASTRYHYSLVYPADWTGIEVLGSGGVHPDEPGVDTYHGKRGYILSVVGQAGVTALTGWTCSIDHHLEADHKLTPDWDQRLTIDGVPADITSFHLVIAPYVIHYLTVKIVRDGDGLTLSLESTTKDADQADRAVLDSLLAGLSLS